MNKNTENKSSAETLRQKAEELLKKKSEAKILELIEELAFQNDEKAKWAEELVIANKELAFQNEEKAKRADELIIANAHALKLTHELEVHQIELKMQNEELLAARSEAVASSEKYFELYDLAPSGYFTLSRKGEIIGLNLTGAMMLGKERLYLQNAKFDFFVSADTKHGYNLFLEKAFSTKTKESCEITLTTSSKKSLYVHLSGIVAKNGTQCMVTAVDITERRHVEKKLEDIIDKNPMSIQILNSDGYTIKTNSAHLNLFGAVVPQGYSLFQDPQLVQQGFGTYFDRIINGEVVSFPDSYFNAHDVDPSFPDIPVTIKALGFPLTDSNGITEKIVLMQENITDRKQAENEIKKKSAILNNLIINLQEGILLEDSNRKIGLTNQLFCDMFAIPAPPEALAGADCSESAEQNKQFFTNPEQFVAGINFILANKKAVYNDELELLDGRHFERDYIPTWFSEVYSGHLWKYRDITERKHAQQKLQASEERYRSIFQGSPLGILIADAESKKITYANLAQCHAFGYTEEQFKTMSIADIHPLETFGHTLAEFESMLNGEKALAENIQCLKRNGEIFYADISGALISLNGKSQLLGFFKDITERKNTEAELKKRSQAVEQSPVIVYITNLDGFIEYANAKATEVSGYSNNELVGQNPRIFSSGEKPKEEYKTLWQTISSGKEWKGEFHNKKKTGGLYWVAASISPVINNLGEVTHYVAIEEDVTERKIAEQKIHDLNTNLELTVNIRTAQFKEALNRLEKIADRVPGVVYQYQLNPDGSSCFPFASEGIRDIYRVSPEEVAHDASIVFTRIHPADSDGVLASIQASAKYNTLWIHEYRVKFDDGTVRWLSGNAQPQTEADGTILWHGYISDITERKQAEDNLKESTERHRGLSEAAFDSIFFSEKGICIEQNQMAEKIFGYTNEEAIGRYGTEWIVEADRKMVMDNMLAGNEEPYEVTAIRKNGTTFPCMLSGRMMHYKGRTVRVTSLSDITQRKQAEVALIKAKTEAEKANLAKSEFLSRMSHELRTPMNSILGFAQLMEMGGELSPKHNKSVSYILNNGRHLLNLINEVLDIAGIEAGRQILTLEPVQLDAVINEITDSIEVAASKRNVSIELVDSPANILFALADRVRLKQILINLLNNAIKYNNAGGSITIKTALQPSNEHGHFQVRISICDTGNGIRPEDIGKLFQAFERIGADRTEAEGTGLGLMVVKKLAEAMNGTVGVESEVGTGSTFWIELPQTENVKQAVGHTSGSPTPELPTTKHAGIVLYIEDNLANIELVQEIMAEHRPEIHLVTSINGKQTVKLAKEHKPGLILLDLDLPDIKGIEVLEQLLANPQTKTIPVIIISADAMPFQVEKLMKVGALDYVTKPLNVVQFLKTIDRHIII